jgi:hypothetical protein
MIALYTVTIYRCLVQLEVSPARLPVLPRQDRKRLFHQVSEPLHPDHGLRTKWNTSASCTEFSYHYQSFEGIKQCPVQIDALQTSKATKVHFTWIWRLFWAWTVASLLMICWDT